MADSYRHLITSRLGIILSLLISMSGLWFYLFYKIKLLTYETPSNSFLLFLGMLHYVVFLIIIISLLLVFISGIYLSESRPRYLQKIKYYSEKTSTFFFSFWLYFVGIIILFGLTYTIRFFFRLGESPSLIFIVIMMLVVLFYSVIYFLTLGKLKTGKFFKKKFIFREVTPTSYLVIVGFIILGIIVYPLIMGILFSDVQVTLDKEFYNSNDSLQMSVRSKSYIFNPTIKEVSYFGREIWLRNESNLASNNLNIKINLSEYYKDPHSNTIIVKFESQIIKIKKERTIDLKIVP